MVDVKEFAFTNEIDQFSSFDIDQSKTRLPSIDKDSRNVWEMYHLLHDKFDVPFTKRRLRTGYSALFTVLPAGSTINLGINVYLWKLCKKYNMSTKLQRKLMGRMIVSWMVGLIPVVGCVFDLLYHGDKKNFEDVLCYLNALE